MRKKFTLIFSSFLSVSLTTVLGISFVSASQFKFNTNSNKNTNQRISLQDEKRLNNQANSQSVTTLGQLRKWQNNNFTGIQLNDGGFAVLTGNSTSGYATSRTDSFGGVLWTYNPSIYNPDSTLVAGNDQVTSYESSGLKNKAVVEIQQDAANPSTYYALLVPKLVLDNPDKLGDITYEQLQTPAQEASVVQIKENLNDLNNPFEVTAFANINPKIMVDNYPSTWKVAGGPSFFSKADHPSWFDLNDTSNTMSMPAYEYITNIGNMYIVNGYVLIFGGNGSQFSDPDALSIGVFRLNFNDPKNIKVTGIPYAYVLAGISTNFYAGRYFSRLPVGQNATFSYVPRMAVGGVSAYPGLKSNQSQTIFLAGSLTVGQDNESWVWANAKSANARPTIIGLSADPSQTPSTRSSTPPTTTSDAKGYGSYGDKHYSGGAYSQGKVYQTRWSYYGQTTTTPPLPTTNFIPTSALQSNPTQKNSVDPLTLAGFKVNLSALLSLDTTTIANVNDNNSDRSYSYIIDSNYLDFGINIGFVLGFYIDSNSYSEYPDYPIANVTGGPGQYGRPQQAWDGGLGMFTSLFGYSPKSVSNLVPYNSQRTGPDGKFNNLGFVLQVGAFIYFFNLTGYDGYAQLPSPEFNPVISQPAGIIDPSIQPPASINNVTSGQYTQYYNYIYMPSSAWNYDATIGNTPSYFDANNNQLAGADPTKLAQVKPWSDFAGLSVINSNTVAVTSTWSTSSGVSSVYVNTGFNGDGLIDSDNRTLSAIIDTTDNLIQVQNYRTSGSFLINNAATGDTSINNMNAADSEILSNISGVINTPNQTNYYFQRNNSGINYYTYNPVDLILNASFQNAVVDRKKYLGEGAFIADPSEAITTKNIEDLYDKQGDLNILKPSFINQIFNYQDPTNFIDSKHKVLPDKRILLSNINVVTQSATFTAQILNPFTNQYETIPSSSGNINQNAHVTYEYFFGKQPSYVLAVAVAVPIVVVALAVGLGCGIGIPVSKNKKALKRSFDVSNKKVDTLTTAVGSVFKKIITHTQIVNIKSPQMLSAKNKTDVSKNQLASANKINNPSKAPVKPPVNFPQPPKPPKPPVSGISKR